MAKGTKVAVLVPGKYNDQHGCAMKRNVGDVFSTRHWYALKLEERGLVEVQRVGESGKSPSALATALAERKTEEPEPEPEETTEEDPGPRGLSSELLEDAGLSPKLLYEVMQRWSTLGDVADATDSRLCSIRGIGRATVSDIRQFLEEQGIE